MTETQLPTQSLNQVSDNPILMDRVMAEPVCEGLTILLASFQALYLQYQKHHFVVEGAEFYMLHPFFEESYESAHDHVHEIGERLNGLGGVPVASLAQLVNLCCFTPEPDGVYPCRQMLEHDLSAEQAIMRCSVLRLRELKALAIAPRATCMSVSC